MTYFTIMNGLRGCYMPDNASVAAFKTRREFKSYVAWEASQMNDAYGFGGSKRAVSAFVAECWRRRKDTTWSMDLVLPFARTKGDYAFGLMVSRATRADYLTYCEENA